MTAPANNQPREYSRGWSITKAAVYSGLHLRAETGQNRAVIVLVLMKIKTKNHGACEHPWPKLDQKLALNSDQQARPCI